MGNFLFYFIGIIMGGLLIVVGVGLVTVIGHFILSNKVITILTIILVIVLRKTTKECRKYK